jgi:hypothetical protein
MQRPTEIKDGQQACSNRSNDKVVNYPQPSHIAGAYRRIEMKIVEIKDEAFHVDNEVAEYIKGLEASNEQYQKQVEELTLDNISDKGRIGELKKEISNYDNMEILRRDGGHCGHRGCLAHITHPCEGCGRIGGRGEIRLYLPSPAIKSQPEMPDLVTFLPECKWKESSPASSVTLCCNEDSRHFDGPCSKRCGTPEKT